MKLPFIGQQAKPQGETPLHAALFKKKARCDADAAAARAEAEPAAKSLKALTLRIDTSQSSLDRLQVRRDQEAAVIAEASGKLTDIDERRKSKLDQLAADVATGNEAAEEVVNVELAALDVEAQRHSDAIAAAGSRLAAFNRQTASELEKFEVLERELAVLCQVGNAANVKQAEAAWDNAVNSLAVAMMALVRATAVARNGAKPAHLGDIAIPYFDVDRALFGQLAMSGLPSTYGRPTLNLENLRSASTALHAGEQLDEGTKVAPTAEVTPAPLGGNTALDMKSFRS